MARCRGGCNPVIESGHLKALWRPREQNSMNWQHILDLMHREMASGIVGSSVARLLLAAILGGIIGLEREVKNRAAGIRTNMFICFGAAMFTLLSRGLATDSSEYMRIASNIIPGIGFIGAGSILHTKGLTSGLTTAATIFVVASVGMAAGGGLFVTAIFATVGVLIALFSLGHLEVTFNLKQLLVSYEVSGSSVEEVSHEVNRILEREHRIMQNVATASTAQHVRVQFDVNGSNREQKQLLHDLKASRVLSSAITLGPVERE
jgi:putative Mg2+ transporter-C (MgtC) family protein